MQYELNFYDELIVDNFAGGGGASWGIEAAIRRPVDIAVNLKVRLIGNSVPPQFVEAIVKANYSSFEEYREVI